MFSSEYSTHVVLWLCAVLSLAGSVGSVFLHQFSPLQSCASEVPSCRASTAPLPYESSMCLTTDFSRKKLKRNCRIKLGLWIPLPVFWKAKGWNRTSLTIVITDSSNIDFFSFKIWAPLLTPSGPRLWGFPACPSLRILHQTSGLLLSLPNFHEVIFMSVRSERGNWGKLVFLQTSVHFLKST